MNLRVVLSAALLLVFVPAAKASNINPLDDTYTITVDNTVLSKSNASFNDLSGVLTFQSGLLTYTFLEVDAAPLVTALSVTRSCAVLNFGGCDSSIVSFSKAGFLDNSLQASAYVGTSLSTSVSGGVPNLVFAHSDVKIGVQSALIGFNAAGSGSSVTPEPGTMTLVMSGVLCAAGAARRRFWPHAAADHDDTAV